MRPNGHILGSVFAEFDLDGVRLVFSGDLGRKKPILLKPSERLNRADYLVLESTYGDRLHDGKNPEKELEAILTRTIKRGGILYIPAFAVGRAQDLLYLLKNIVKKSKLKVPVYLDSPMAIEVGDVFARFLDWTNISQNEAKDMFRAVHLVRSAKESESLIQSSKPAVVIAGSGMITGGRILGHLTEGISDPRNTVLLVGYQAPGTRGRLMLDGASEVKIRGRFLPVRAEVARISSLSAHADWQEAIDWLDTLETAPQKIFLNHGDPQPQDYLRVQLERRFHGSVIIAKEGGREKLA